MAEKETTVQSAAGGKTDPRFLEFLVCPVTRTSLDYDAEKQELISRAAGLAFPVRDGVPIMLIDEARQIKDDEK